MAAVVGVRDQIRQSGTVSAERVPGGGKPDSPNQAARAAALVRSGARHLGRNRKTSGKEGSAGNRLYRQTRHDPGWYWKLIAQKFDGSKHRQYPGRPRIDAKLEALIVRMGRENSGWGYDRIVGALANLGHAVSDQTVGNILRRYGIQPAPKRSQNTTWKDFIASHLAVLAGTDFFTVEVLTWRGLATYYVLFFIHLESRRVTLAGLTRDPTSEWMLQMARNATDESSGFLRGQRYLLHDRDTKFCP